jgi:hypothetical protein
MERSKKSLEAKLKNLVNEGKRTFEITTLSSLALMLCS